MDRVTVSLCVATRGRPDLLRASVAETCRGIEQPDTRIVLGVDMDDAPSIAAADDIRERHGDRIVVSVAAREDSLGAKYNRCHMAQEADLYVVGCDDTSIVTKGWDWHLSAAANLFEDGIGTVYFGNNLPGVFQAGIAITSRQIAMQGYFMQPYTPFWWHDTWADEIGRMLDRVIGANVHMSALGPIGETRGAREIAFWAAFFDHMRADRIKTVNAIIDADDFREQAYRKHHLRSQIPAYAEAFLARNRNLRDPAEAAGWERRIGIDAPADERYLRLKAQAEAVMQQPGSRTTV